MLSKASLRLNARSGRAARLAYSLVIRQRPPFSPAARLLPVAASRRPLFDRDNEDASQAGGRLTDDGELLSEAGDALPEALGDADQWGDLAARNFMATQPSSDPRGPSQLVGAAGAAGAAGSNPWGEGDVDSLPPDYWNTDKERVYLVGLALKSERKKVDTYSVAESLEELAQLADTAGCRVTGRTFQVRWLQVWPA